MKQPLSKTIVILLAAMLTVMSSGCQRDNVEPAVKPVIAYVYYTFTLDPDMLDYFDITAWYVNPEGQRTGYPLVNTSSTIYTTAESFANERSLTFSMNRKGTSAPAQTPNWITKIQIDIEVNMSDGTTKKFSSTQTNNYSPSPDNFDEWCNWYAVRLGVGYRTYIKYNGDVIFSTE